MSKPKPELDYSAINRNPNNFPKESPNLQKLLRYCKDNDVQDYKQKLKDIGDDGFLSLIRVRSLVLGEDYQSTVPFLEKLYLGNHDPYFLVQYYANKLQCQPEDLIQPAIPDPNKDLLESLQIADFVRLLTKALTAIADTEIRASLANSLDFLVNPPTAAAGEQTTTTPSQKTNESESDEKDWHYSRPA